jgi:hypothetical protein
MIGGQAAAEGNTAHKVAWLRLDPAIPAWERQLLGGKDSSSSSCRGS